MYVIKRDGKKVLFDVKFIEKAILAAANSADVDVGTSAEQIANGIVTGKHRDWETS